MGNQNIVVFSGGSAANNLVDIFSQVAKDKNASLNYVIPISDNGGSSSELIRVFGGPGIGDCRSRLVRLIPEPSAGQVDPERTAIKALFNHRLPSNPTTARLEWLSIVESTSPLWIHITPSKKELIRSFLNLLNLEIVKRARPSSIFNFQSASVGNLFLTGARLFSGSLESAIYLLASITGIDSSVKVIPAINSNFSHHISAGLADGTIITGQNAISHPTTTTAVPTATDAEAELMTPTSSRRLSKELSEYDRVEDGSLPGSLPTLRRPNIEFAKDVVQELPARIERIWYINPYGQEIRPAPNAEVISALERSHCAVYSIGSLYTSIIPCLILRGVGEAISRLRFKILILNGSLDRETGPASRPFGAWEFVKAVAGACASSRGRTVVPEMEWSEYVTHVIHLEGEGAPKVDRERLRDIGVECVRIYGRKGGSGMLYDGKALMQALEAILGRRDPRADKSRRNTLER